MVMVLTALPMSLIQPTATSAQAGPDRTYSWIVEKRECPPGFDPASSSPDVANNTCPPVTGVPFTLSSDNPAYPGDTRFAINGGNGQLAWNDLPANTTYSVTEEIPLGYEQAAISCVLYADPNNPNAGNGDPGFSYGPGGVSAYLPAEGYDGLNTVFCRFYNVPSNQNGQENGAQPTEETGGTENEAATILLRKYTCVQRFDEEDESRPSLLDRCRQGMPGTRFAVSSGNGQPQIIDVNQNGEANYAMFPGGTVDIAERDTAWPHPMQPIVYCALQTNGSPAPEPMRADVQPNGRITYDVQGGQTLVCDWFNIFLSTGVQLLKLACPEDIDPVSSDLQFLRERCVPQPGVHFDIEIEDQDGSTLTSGPTRPDGRSAPTLFNTSQPQATYQSTIVETVPEGYASSRVFCSMARQNEYPDPVTEVQLSTSNSYSFEQPWDSVVACAWFNFIPKENGNLPPTETQEPNGYGQVIVQKYLCSDGYPSGGSYDDFANACSNSNTGSGYGFSVAVANYGYQESQTTDSAGHAEWPNVPAGTVEITEADAPGYVPVAVYCGWDLAGSENGPDTYSEVTLVGSTIAYELTDNLQIVCKWFNAPENVGAVDENAIAINIHKYVCPVGYDPYEVDDVDAARSMCVEPQGGVTFGMEENGEAAVESQTDADGNVTLPYYGKTGILYEIPPPGYQTGGFYCALITGSGPQSYQRTSPYPDDEYPITTGGVPLGSVIDCYWFNIPIPGANGENGENGNGATATVYIHKFSCPEGYDPYTVDDVDIVRSMCVNPQSGVTFGLEEDGHPTTEVETDLNGDATLPYYGGAGSLYELPPPGYQAGALYCAISANGETGLYERLQVMLDNHYPVSSPDLPPGTTIDCYWFNVPVEGANGENGNGANTTVYIHKFSCPDGYDPYQADDVDAARSMCVNPQSGVTIGLEEDGHPATEVETDLSGDATLPYYGEAGLLYETRRQAIRRVPSTARSLRAEKRVRTSASRSCSTTRLRSSLRIYPPVPSSTAIGSTFRTGFSTPSTTFRPASISGNTSARPATTMAPLACQL